MSVDWRQISEEHGPSVWRTVYKILQSYPESLDCYQNVLLEAFQHSGNRTIDNWPAYLRWLAVRRAIDHLRRIRRNANLIDHGQDVGDVSLIDRQPGSSLELQELVDRLRVELTALPAAQAEAFWLRFVEQMSYAEIAEQMGIESNAVGVLIHRARTHVRSALSDLQTSEL